MCSLILGIESQIRGVFVFHHNDELLAGEMCEGIQPHLTSEEVTKSVYNTILRWQTRESLHPFIGVGNTLLLNMKK